MSDKDESCASKNSSKSKTRLIICSVGISLLDKMRDNNGMNMIKEYDRLKNHLEANRDNPERIAFRNDSEKNDLYKLIDEVVKALQEIWNPSEFNKYIEEFLNQKIKETRSKSPAEIASLHDLLREGCSWKLDTNYSNRIILLCSDTPEGVFCARCIKDFLSNNVSGFGTRDDVGGGNSNNKDFSETGENVLSWGSCGEVFSGEKLFQENAQGNTSDKGFRDNLSCLIEKGGLVLVEGLKIDKAARFREEGLGGLAGVLSRILERATSERNSGNIDQICVVATGGYKPESIYMFVIGSLFGAEVYYLHERSMSNLRMPVLPLDYDVTTWAEYKDILRVLDGQPADLAAGLIDSLPEQLRRLFEKKESNIRLNHFGRITAGFMEERLPALSRYGRGMLLTDRIKEEDLRKRIESNVLENWRYLWLGDRIPETVEHARGHTQRLLAFATQLLTPIFEKEEDFMNDAELFVLLSAIWLHDIGHGATELPLPDGRIKAVMRLPTVVRDLHHWLTYGMLLSDEKDGYRLGEYREAVAKVCLYHRGKMPVKEGEKPFVDDASGIKIEKAICEKIYVRIGKSEVQVRTRFLASLLRMIDACDVQLERTVDKSYARARAGITKKEMEAELERMRKLKDILSDPVIGIQGKEWYDSFCTINKNVEAFKEKVETLLNATEDGFNETFNEYDALRGCLRENLNNAIKHVWNSCDGTISGLLEAWVESASAVVFKAEQDFHFLKHRQIQNVAILFCPEETARQGGNKEGNLNFQVALWPADNSLNFMVRKIKEEIETEIQQVEENIKPIKVDVSVIEDKNRTGVLQPGR